MSVIPFPAISSPKAINADVYDSIKGNVHMFIPEGEDGFCAKTYYASKGIHILGYFEDYTALEIESNENKPIYYYAESNDDYFTSQLKSNYSEESFDNELLNIFAPIIIALILGIFTYHFVEKPCAQYFKERAKSLVAVRERERERE